MGPLYGKMFRGFSKELEGIDEISANDFSKALEEMSIRFRQFHLPNLEIKHSLIPYSLP